MNRQKTKILFLNHACELGGAERVLLTLLNGIDKGAFDCWLVCPEEGDLIEQASCVQGVNTKIIEIPPGILQMGRKGLSFLSLLASTPKLASSISRLKRFIEDQRFNLIYTNSTKADIYGSLAGLLTRVPVVWRVHDILSQDFFDTKITCLLSMIANIVPKKILCVSNSVLTSLEAAGIPKRKLITIYNGVEVTSRHDSPCSIRKEFGLPPESILVGWFGRVISWKGPEVFIRAARNVLDVCDNVYFVIVGGTLHEAESYYHEIVDFSREVGIDGRVIFTGYRQDPLHLMASVDILTHTSILPDPLPTVLLEGAWLGKAMVAANAGGVPEIIQNGKEGLLVPPGDVGALSQALMDLIKNPDRIESLGKAAKEKASRRFSMEAYVGAVEQVLKGIG